MICTHLHIDHVGWNTRLVDGRWIPTFPNARYLLARHEWEHWSADADPVNQTVLGDSVRPIFDAGLVDLVEPDHAVDAAVSLEPTPGHTPGHVSVHVRSRGEEAVITGDLVHHPAQFARPHWGAQRGLGPRAGRPHPARVHGALCGHARARDRHALRGARPRAASCATATRTASTRRVGKRFVLPTRP